MNFLMILVIHRHILEAGANISEFIDTISSDSDIYKAEGDTL